RLEHFAMNQVVNRFADENAAGVVRPEQVIAIRRGTVGGSHMTVRADDVETLERLADKEDLGGILVVGESLRCSMHGQSGIPHDIMFMQEEVITPGAIVIAKP